MSVEYSRRPFSIAEYEQMVETGIFDEDDRLELIEGDIVAMSPIGTPHAACVRRLTRVLSRLLGEQCQTSVQCPVAIPDWSAPNPDVALLAPRADDYARAHPLPRHVRVLIEVADTSLAYDTNVKAPLYARAGIREYWIVDLQAKRIVVYTRPRAGRFASVVSHGLGDRFNSQRFPGVEFVVRDLIPPGA